MEDPRVLEQDLPRRAHTRNMTLSLTLALKDSALGTTPLSHRQTAVSLLKADVSHVFSAIPSILSAFAASIINNWRVASVIDLRRIFIYILVSLLELQLLLSIGVLWLVVPGLALLPWLGVQGASIWLLLRLLNKGQRPFTVAADKHKETSSSDEETSSDWFVVGGLVHNERMRQELPSKLTKIFGHDMRVFIPHSLGFLFDAVMMFLQRNIPISTERSVALYESIRASLLKPETSRVYILAHNTGTLDVSWLLSRLCADLPPDRLGKLQVFTFGAVSIEMTLPLGTLVYQQDRSNEDTPCPTITHFAFADDPFAQIGVLLGIRQRLEGRFIGSLYTIHNVALPLRGSRWLPRRRHYTFEDYLDTLLPCGDPRAGVLGQVCKIDRELSEMRELAALAQSVTNERLRTRRARLSWTALGVVANSLSGSNGCKDRDDMAGPFSLEEVRKKGRSLEGSKGYENNSLADAVKSRY
ncbi:hypothetical protein GGR54DRAFT_640922 [Hypoxylon sp. NC1633]|nr:hypothetical protein GGR54DRAFT_640922 [Hypoxylon sp. NC1633]